MGGGGRGWIGGLSYEYVGLDATQDRGGGERREGVKGSRGNMLHLGQKLRERLEML